MDEVIDEGEAGKVSKPGSVFSRAEAQEWAKAQRSAGRSLVFTNGCFDILHFGHLGILQEASRHGDLLVVGLNADVSVRRLKGEGRPVNGETERARLLAHLSPVDAVVIFEEDTPLELIQDLKPHVLVKGDEYEESEIVGAEDIRSWGGEVVRYPMQEGFSTTGTLKKMEEHS
jgi:D-beta-D-heptose 7-phosphate kinase/D-beta-D-heptose 1-phosphate adenosyltransferase